MKQIFEFFRDDVASLPIWALVVLVVSGSIILYTLGRSRKDETGQADEEAIKRYKDYY